MEGRKEGRKEGSDEGRKEVRKEGREEGYGSQEMQNMSCEGRKQACEEASEGRI